MVQVPSALNLLSESIFFYLSPPIAYINVYVCVCVCVIISYFLALIYQNYELSGSC